MTKFDYLSDDYDRLIELLDAGEKVLCVEMEDHHHEGVIIDRTPRSFIAKKERDGNYDLHCYGLFTKTQAQFRASKAGLRFVDPRLIIKTVKYEEKI